MRLFGRGGGILLVYVVIRAGPGLQVCWLFGLVCVVFLVWVWSAFYGCMNIPAKTAPISSR